MPGPLKGSPDPPCLPPPPRRINWSLRRRVALCSDLASSAVSHYILLSCSHADFLIVIYWGLATRQAWALHRTGLNSRYPHTHPGEGTTMLHFSDGEEEAWSAGISTCPWPLCPRPQIAGLGQFYGERFCLCLHKASHSPLLCPIKP